MWAPCESAVQEQESLSVSQRQFNAVYDACRVLQCHATSDYDRLPFKFNAPESPLHGLVLTVIESLQGMRVHGSDDSGDDIEMQVTSAVEREIGSPRWQMHMEGGGRGRCGRRRVSCRA